LTTTTHRMPAPRLICQLIRRFGKRLPALTLLTAYLLAQPIMAQSSTQTPATKLANDKMVAIEIPPQPDAIELGTGPLPPAPDGAPESWHSQYNSMFARNVTVATLRPFLPVPSNASGAAVIVAPGGGFRVLSMENEGWNVARALADHGVAAFVLKYRLNPTPADLDEFARSSSPRPPGTRPATRPSPAEMASRIGPQIADANAAFALVRANAAKWHVDPDRIGMIGFSAGAMLTMATTLRSHEANPAFIANIYGGLAAVDVPPDAPPLFAAVAADDPLLGAPNFGLIENWRKAKRPVEFHYYEQGGHGFGMYPKETTSTGWFDAYIKWLGMHGYLKPKT
jgi:acetyl esterase/lipase